MNCSSQDSRSTQRARLLGRLLKDAGSWVSLAEILDLRISQYSARILELRRSGFVIENRTERVDGQTRSWFRLEPGPKAIQSELALTGPENPRYGD